MCNDLVPLLFLVVAPLIYLAHRSRLFDSAILRSAGVLFLLALVFLKLPLAGMDQLYLERLKLLLAAWMILVLLLRSLRVSWWTERRHYRAVLIFSALAALLVHFNFFAFHGSRIFAHHHDVAHYYLGSKYFAELGYGRIYTAMLRAEGEEFDNHFASSEARDLATNRMVPIQALLAGSDAVKARFSPRRWQEFRSDVAYFQRLMGPGFGVLFEDHGFNPTPLWALLGGWIANRVPAGSAAGSASLTLLDPLLELAALAAIVWAFDIETALLALIHFTVIFGASFDWIGGAYLRYLWFAATILAVCCLRRGRHAAAGGLLVLASLLRVFPAFFLAAIGLKAAGEVVRTGGLSAKYRRFFLSSLAAAAILITVTAWMPGGIGNWEDFARNSATHLESLSSNFVGLTNLAAYSSGGNLSEPHGLVSLFEWRQFLYELQLGTVFVLALALVALVGWQVDEVSATALGILLIVTGINLTAYYYSFLVLLVLAWHDRPDKLAMVFFVELATCAQRLFEEHLVMIFLYRGWMVLCLILALYFDQIENAFGLIRDRMRRDRLRRVAIGR